MGRFKLYIMKMKERMKGCWILLMLRIYLDLELSCDIPCFLGLFSKDCKCCLAQAVPGWESLLFFEQLWKEGCNSFYIRHWCHLYFTPSVEHIPSRVMQFLKISFGGGGCLQYSPGELVYDYSYHIGLEDQHSQGLISDLALGQRLLTSYQ